VLRQNVRCHHIIGQNYFHHHQIEKQMVVMKKCPLKNVWGMWRVLLD